jgi:hypothetical protein
MKKLESILVTLAIVLIVGSATSQILMKYRVIEAEGYTDEDAISYLNSSIYRQDQTIKLKISEYPESILLINGEVAKLAAIEGDYNIFTVYNNDVLELDLRNVGDVEVSVFVAGVSDGIDFPKEGTKLFVSGGIKSLFKITTKDANELSRK